MFKNFLIRRLFKFKLGKKTYRIGDKVKCETDWGLSKAQFEGIIIYDNKRHCFGIDGEITSFGDKHKRCFPIHECYNFDLKP